MATNAELREMSDEQLALTLKDTCEGFFRLRIQAQTERLDAPSELRHSPQADRSYKRRFKQNEQMRHRRPRPRNLRLPKAGPLSRTYLSTEIRRCPSELPVGVVKSDKMTKSRVVEIPRLVKHPMYGKIIRRRTVCYVHDENNESSMGDTVEIVEARPTSKKKRWNLVRVVEKSRDVDVAALKAAAKESEGTSE